MLDSRGVSEAARLARDKDRRWEIHTRYGTDHRPEEKLEDAVAAHLARFQHPAGADVPAGTVRPWQHGEPAGDPRPLAVELASARERVPTVCPRVPARAD